MSRKQSRLDTIINLLKANTSMGIQDMARTVGVSEMTVRRDLKVLAEREIVTILHGAALLNTNNYYEQFEKHYSLIHESRTRQAEKKRIGAYAATLVKNGDSLIIDSGTTTEWLARQLPPDIEISCLCFALNILVETNRNGKCRTVFTGGDLHRETLVCESPESKSIVERYRGTMGFFSAQGVHPELGVTCSATYEIEIKMTALKSCLHRVLLVDSSKLGQVGPGFYAGLDDFSTLITDTEAPDEFVEKAESKGIEVVRV